MSLIPGNIIAAMINFLILYLILKKVFFKPVNNIINSRKKEIENSYDQLEQSKKEIEAMRIESEKKINNIKQEGSELLENYKQKAEKTYSEIINNAEKESELILQRAKKEAEYEEEKVKNKIKKEIVDVSFLMTEKVLEKRIDEEEHRKLINEFITKGEI